MAYPTDLTDEQWELLEPVLGVGGSRGPQPRSDRRRLVDAVLYQARTGCQWRYLPAEFGSWNTVWRTFARWRDRGVWQHAMDVLRLYLRVREGRDPEPSMVMVDCQVTKGGRRGGVARSRITGTGAPQGAAAASQRTRTSSTSRSLNGLYWRRVGTRATPVVERISFTSKLSTGPYQLALQRERVVLEHR